ncbi:sulfide-dependent adenosine diphosphate thiazole synthase [Archaeoglobus neptunius]|uniref:sulfide-dependent adenosine diphosphate thiazole synthase n=1 Tax=Archaeoglobus neptunius TaxID=2798580 RepID=UPI001928BA02|nr:sulfide-dependent adenosine diphosphate thiazole synthase [Archaeoglobus neptunius]
MEAEITRAIIESASEEWVEFAESDVIIVGAGPSGLTAAKYIAEKGFKTLVLERRLSFGGGIGGGGMLFHKIVAETEAKDILDDFGIAYKERRNLLVIDAAEMMAKLAVKAIDSGAKILHGVSVEDVIFREDPLAVKGVCVQWSAVEISGLHVDPIFLRSRAVVDATGHDAEVISVAARKIPLEVHVPGERSAHSEVAEKEIVEKTGKVVKGLYAAGMAVAALHNLPRMGPIFGGMLISGKKIADVVAEDLS